MILLSDCFRLFSLLSRCLFSHFSSFTIARFYYRRSSLALHHSVLRRRSAIFTPSTPPVFFSPSFFLSFPFYLPSLSFRRSSVRAPKQFWRPFFYFNLVTTRVLRRTIFFRLKLTRNWRSRFSSDGISLALVKGTRAHTLGSRNRSTLLLRK